MKITLFTSNQPRHKAYVRSLAQICDELFVVHEVTTVVPGVLNDFYRSHPLYEKHFASVMEAEKKVFGNDGFVREPNVSYLPAKMADLNHLSPEVMAPALESDVYLVFGAAFIKGWLIDHLVENQAVNLHMGVSPFYRGSSTNFWAQYDRKFEFVGATVHKLTKGLDSGPMYYHAFPKPDRYDSYELGMRAVLAGQQSIIQTIKSGGFDESKMIPQDKSLQIRYTRNADFTPEILEEFLNNIPTPDEIQSRLQSRDESQFLNLVYG